MNGHNYSALYMRRLILITVMISIAPMTISAVLLALVGAIAGIGMLLTWSAATAEALQYVAIALGFGLAWLAGVYFGIPRLYRWSLAPALRRQPANEIARGAAADKL